MNREEILAMEAGDKLNRAVAEQFFNYKVEEKQGFYEFDTGEFMEMESGPDRALCYLANIELGLWRALPCFSTDILAAWQVVEKLVKRYVFDLYFDDVGECWVCKLFDGANEYRGYGTAPEAISKVVLLARQAITQRPPESGEAQLRG